MLLQQVRGAMTTAVHGHRLVRPEAVMYVVGP